MISVYIIAQVFFCPTAISITHYAYRHFKDLSSTMVGIFPPNQPNQPHPEPDRPYQRVPEPNENVFGGQGVRIG